MTVTEDQIEECAKLLAKMWSQERDYPFWGNEMVYFRKVVRELVSAELRAVVE